MRRISLLKRTPASMPWGCGPTSTCMNGALNWVEADERREELRERYERLRAWDYPVEWVTPQQVMDDLAPELRLDAGLVRDMLHVPAEGWIDAPLFIVALLGKTQRLGARLRSNTRVR